MSLFPSKSSIRDAKRRAKEAAFSEQIAAERRREEEATERAMLDPLSNQSLRAEIDALKVELAALKEKLASK